MTNRQLFLVLFVLISSSSTLSQDSNWDVLVFAQAWPKSVCLSYENESGQHCGIRNKDGWTIHGIWPNAAGTMGPSFCKSPIEFNKESIKDLVPELEKKWNSKKEGNEVDFWKYQWDKHGKCGAQVLPLDKYFRQALDWSRKYDLRTILSAGGIVPDEKEYYTVENVLDTVKNQLKVVPIIKCSSVEGELYLDEIRLCFNAKLKLVNCFPRDPPSPYSVQCSSQDKILYAPSSSPFLNIDTLVLLLAFLFTFYKSYC